MTDDTSTMPRADMPAPVGGHTARPSRWFVLGGTLLTLVAVGLVVSAVLFSVRLSRYGSVSSAREAALAQARQTVVNFTTFDYRHLDQQFALVTKDATGDFKSEFEKEAKTIRQRFVSGKTVSTGTIRDAAVTSATKTEASVVVAVDDLIKSSAAPKGVPFRYRLQVHMVKVNGRWLVENVSPVV